MDTENSQQFSKKASNDLKVGDIILIESGKNEYVKIGNITTAKPGKHGSTKFLVKGTNILTKKKHEVSFTSGTKVTAVKLKRTEYALNDIDHGDVHVTGQGSENAGFETLDASNFSEKDIDLLKSAFNRDSDSLITFVVVSAPNLAIVEDVRKDGKLFEK